MRPHSIRWNRSIWKTQSIRWYRRKVLCALFGIQEGEDRKNGSDAVFEQLMVKIFPKLITDIKA